MESESGTVEEGLSIESSQKSSNALRKATGALEYLELEESVKPMEVLDELEAEDSKSREILLGYDEVLPESNKVDSESTLDVKDVTIKKEEIEIENIAYETSSKTIVSSGVKQVALKRTARNSPIIANRKVLFDSPLTRQPDGNRTRARACRDKALLDEMKFMADFDPSSSNRNLEKKRKRYTDGKSHITADYFDDCDCLVKDCPGCHYPCKRCKDTRCGHECRKGRKWLYESIEIQGRGIELKNPHSLQ